MCMCAVSRDGTIMPKIGAVIIRSGMILSRRHQNHSTKSQHSHVNTYEETGQRGAEGEHLMGLSMDTSPTHHLQPALQETPSRFSCSLDRHQAILLSAQAKVYISTCVRGIHPTHAWNTKWIFQVSRSSMFVVFTSNNYP